MSRPKNKDEHRKQLAEMFVNILEEDKYNWSSGLKKFIADRNHNPVTKNVYKGCNLLHLYLVSKMKGYNDPRWVTMVQIMDKQGKYHPNEKWKLKKGTKATYVEYWYPFDFVNKVAITWDKYKEEIKNGRSNKDFALRTNYTAVFNASCVEGMKPLEKAETNEQDLDDILNKLSKNMNVPIEYDDSTTPCYIPTLDKIKIPNKVNFDSVENFNSTLLHEFAHSTGHKERLNRNIENTFASDEYAYEELVAEMSACFMSINIDGSALDNNINNHKAYLQSWVQKIKDEPNVLIKAVKDAEQCAKYMEFKAELIHEKEYNMMKNSSFEVTENKVSKSLKKENKQVDITVKENEKVLLSASEKVNER